MATFDALTIGCMFPTVSNVMWISANPAAELFL